MKINLRVAAYAFMIPAALVTAFLGTRGGSEQAVATGHEGHGAAAASGPAQAVMLTADDARRIGVTFDVVALTALAREVRTVGQVTYDETRVRTVSLKIDGWIETLHANFTGQWLARGAPLMSIYSPMLVTAQEELLLAKRLAADVAGGTAEAQADAASLLASARRRLSYWNVPADVIERIEETGDVQRVVTLRAPVGGYVVDKNVQEGQRVMAGDPLYRVADLQTVWVEGEVFERDLASVRQGQTVHVALDALPGESRTGRITYLYPTIDVETRTSRVRVELPNTGRRLKPGMYATLSWSAAGVAAASVPRSAVFSTGQRDLVFVKRRDGMLAPRAVRLGVSNSERVEILAGLTLGDTVVKSATFLLDAESNLGTLLGGMGEMPGMDLSAPRRADGKREGANAHANH